MGWVLIKELLKDDHYNSADELPLQLSNNIHIFGWSISLEDVNIKEISSGFWLTAGNDCIDNEMFWIMNEPL